MESVLRNVFLYTENEILSFLLSFPTKAFIRFSKADTGCLLLIKNFMRGFIV